jgi:hypothetical protein
VKKAVFVADHETGLGIVFEDQQTQAWGIPWNIKNKVRSIGFSRPQGLRQR